ncbi:hypothetical protein SSX86_025780 [Deinandra increscens subsp. villosa]|uniref:IST1 homolog n=1 Tax=Deinandra increscens subsp. villosa TaxID=3103831 RepID=A0AAP0CDN4_9ASTR
MFDALLKSKFYSRSKSEIKVTLKRIEIIKRKRNAVQKFLRNDVADLLRNGLHSNAYDRVEQLFADQNLSWCYEFVEKSCICIISHLSAMNKQRECPEECKEAISTLIDMGNHLEPYVNKEFVKNLKANIPTKEIKLQMMQEIAMEYDINWDSKVLEQKLYNPPPSVQDQSQYGNGSGRTNESHITHNQNAPETKNQETEKKKTEEPIGHTLKNGLPYNLQAEIEQEEAKTVGNDLPYKSRAEIEAKKEGKHDHGRLSPYWSSNTSTCSETTSTSPDDSASEDTPEGRKLLNIPEERKLGGLRAMGPPYIKPDSSKPAPRSMRVRRPLKPVSGSSHPNNDVSNGENHDLGYDCKDEKGNKMDKVLSGYNRKPLQSPATTRTGSLPCEAVAAGVGVDERKGLARAATYQPESGLGPQGNVRPKVPDYDDFVARLAAFRASS